MPNYNQKNSHKPHNFFTLFIIFCAGLGGVLYGYDIGVISGALFFVQKSIVLNNHQVGLIVGGVLGGCLIGTLITGSLADAFGRKKMIIMACLIFILGITGILLAKNFHALLGARLILGVGVGVISVAIPLYLTEIVPASIRGRSITIFQLLLTFGIVLAYVVDLLFIPSGNWRGMFAVIFIPAIVLLVSMFFLPETPRWLLAKKKIVKAQQVLLKTRSRIEAGEEFNQIQESLKVTQGGWRTLFARSLWLPLTASLIIAVCNQLTGVNVLLQYAPMLIKTAGLPSHFGTMLGTVGIGLVNFGGTILSFFLVDKFGRRILLLVGTSGIIISYVFLGLVHYLVPMGQMQAELSLTGFFSYILFYAIGPGVVVWLAISELLPTKVRGKAVALGLFANSLTGAVLSTMFLEIQNALGVSGTYWLFAGFTIIYFLTAFFLLPETKNKSLEEIQTFYRKKFETKKILREKNP